MRRVLVIDDHEPSRKQILATLKDGGYEIAGEGTSGKLAVALARAALPDVLLMAVGLPDIDGIEAARDVMLAQPLPIVLVTSHFDSSDRRARRNRRASEDIWSSRCGLRNSVRRSSSPSRSSATLSRSELKTQRSKKLWKRASSSSAPRVC